jgi:hypothetical protein
MSSFKKQVLFTTPVVILVFIVAIYVFIVNSLPLNENNRAIYKVIINGVDYFHTFWTALLFFGLLLFFKFKWYRPIHITVVSSTIIGQILFFGDCPISRLRIAICEKVNLGETMDGGFICHYLQKYLGIQPSPEIITAILMTIFVITLFSSFCLFKKRVIKI